MSRSPYQEFTERLRLLVSSNPSLIAMTLSNIFTMRLIGNKTHGDLAEIAMSEFINQYMYDYSSQHVGKDLFRAKSKEEDIQVTSTMTQDTFPVSLKAYGDGPLQLSTDKRFQLFPRLQQEKSEEIDDPRIIKKVFNDPAFRDLSDINVMPLIYDEKKKACNILVFDLDRAIKSTRKIILVTSGGGRKHPVYIFQDSRERYIFEVRYGDAAANALQRGLWTHTKKALGYFKSITSGWIDYSHNHTLVKLFSHALVASIKGHEQGLGKIKEDIERIKNRKD